MTATRHLLASLLVLTLLAAVNSDAQSAYKYRDDKGNWVYTDRKPEASVATEQLTLKSEPVAPRIFIERVVSEQRAVLRAVNECLCTVEFGLQVLNPRNVVVSESGEIRAVLPPRSDKTLVEIKPTGLGAPNFKEDWMYVVGAPGTQHRPARPYRVPYSVGQAFRITQAYPTAITHVTPGSRYAIDIALPDQTAIVAARSGRVINVAHKNFRGGVQPTMLDEANFVEILHDDDTVAMYAHLHWDSIRVHPGQMVSRGEYIADSGNTGFTTGPHLHFSVTRNAGLKGESVAIVFAGPNDAPVTPQTGMMLKAH